MSTNEWTKEPRIEGKLGGCLNCGVRPSLFPLDGVIAVGFGYAVLTCDGSVIYEEPLEGEDLVYMTGEQAEGLAVKDPYHDWRIILEGPIS